MMFSGSFLLNDASPQREFPDPSPLPFPPLETKQIDLPEEALRQLRRMKDHALLFLELIFHKRLEAKQGSKTLEGMCLAYFLAKREGNDECDSVPLAGFFVVEEEGGFDFDRAGQRAAQRMAEESLPELLLESEEADFVSHLQRNARAAKELCLFLLGQQKVQRPHPEVTLPELVASLSGAIAGVYALDTLALYAARYFGQTEPHHEEMLRLASLEVAQNTFFAMIAALRELPAIEDIVEWRDNPLCRLRVLLDGLIYRT